MADKCKVSGSTIPFTPSQPLTKAARAAARGVKTAHINAQREDASVGYIQAPNAPFRLDNAWMNDNHENPTDSKRTRRIAVAGSAAVRTKKSVTIF